MKKTFRLFISITLFLSIFMCLTAYAKDDSDLSYDPNSVIVVFKDNTSDKTQNNIITSNDMKVSDDMTGVSDVKTVEIPDDMSIKEAKTTLEESSKVDYVQPNYRYEVSSTTNDPYVFNANTTSTNMDSYQWHLYFTHLSDTKTSAWNYSTGENINICIMDTGISTNNSDLVYGDNVKNVYNAQTEEKTLESVDDDYSGGHGTHVAGIAAAKGNNSTLGAGVAYNANLYIAKVVDSDGNIFTSDMIKAYNWAVENNCRVINISINGYGFDSEDYALQDAIVAAYNNQSNSVLTVCSAGNSGTTEKSSPSDLTDAYSVTSLKYSSSGTPSHASYSDHSSYKDIAAPGSSILSLSKNNSSSLTEKSGTSMSAPFVSGTAALVMSVAPELSAKQVEDIINETANDLGDKGRDDYYGNGEVNPLKAVQEAIWETSSYKLSDTTYVKDKTNSQAKATFKMSQTVKMTVDICDNDGNVIKNLCEDTEFTKDTEKNIDLDLTELETGSYKVVAYMECNGSTTQLKKEMSFKVVNALELSLSDTSLTPTPGYNEKLTGTVTTNVNGTYSLYVYDENNEIIKTLKKDASIDNSSEDIEWDFKDESGDLINTGSYKIKAVLNSDELSKEVTAEKDIDITINDKPEITSLATSVSSIEKNDFNSVTISYSTNNTCDTIIEIKNSNGETIIKKEYTSTKDNKYVWNLCDNNGKLVDEGTYTVKLTAKNIWGDNYSASKEINLKVTNPGTISYSTYAINKKKIRATGYYENIYVKLSQDAKITISVIDTSTGKTVRTLFTNKVIRKGKTYKYTWNLKKSDGNIAGLKKYKIAIIATNSTGIKKTSGTVQLIKKVPRIKQVNTLKCKYSYSTKIPFKLKTNTIAVVKVVVYNKKGTAIKVLNNSRIKTGTYTFKWNGRKSNGSKAKRGYYKFAAKIKNENGSMTIRSKYFYLK